MARSNRGEGPWSGKPMVPVIDRCAFPSRKTARSKAISLLPPLLRRSMPAVPRGTLLYFAPAPAIFAGTSGDLIFSLQAAGDVACAAEAEQRVRLLSRGVREVES